MSQRVITTCDICNKEYKPHEPTDEEWTEWTFIAGNMTISDICDDCRKWFIKEHKSRKLTVSPCTAGGLDAENSIMREALGSIANCNYKCATDFQEWAKQALQKVRGA